MDEKLRIAVRAAAYYARHLHHDMRVARDRAVRVAAHAVVRAARKEAHGSGMGFPDLAPGFPLVAAGSLISGIGWALHLLRG
jgi:hypothetical protein